MAGENLSPLLFSIFLNDLLEFPGSTSKGVQIDLFLNHYYAQVSQAKWCNMNLFTYIYK